MTIPFPAGQFIFRQAALGSISRLLIQPTPRPINWTSLIGRGTRRYRDGALSSSSVAVEGVNLGGSLMQAPAALLLLRGTFGVGSRYSITYSHHVVELLLIMIVYSGLGSCQAELERVVQARLHAAKPVCWPVLCSMIISINQ